MKILFIASGYLPYTFSENLCNGKLVYALQEEGWQIDVISRKDEGNTYCNEWQEPWLPLNARTYEVDYPVGTKAERIKDIIGTSLSLGVYPIEGIRWVKRALQKAMELHEQNHYDYVLTRSPNDIPHLVGYFFKKKTGVRWIANWNDPAGPIWPEPYTHHFSAMKQRVLMHYTEMCLKAADVNTFPSTYLQHHFEEHFPFLKEKKCVAIPHIATHEDIMPRLEEERNDKLWMCHSGNLSPERNPENLFRAMRELIDEGCDKMGLDIMGYINDYTAELIRKYNLEDYVKCPGCYPYMQAVQKMASYNVLVLVEAILEKGIFFPSKLTDYAQLNKPIFAVSPKSGFAHDLITKYGGGIHVDNSDYKQVKEGLKQLYTEWQTGTLKEHFAPTKICDYLSAGSVVRIYKELLA